MFLTLNNIIILNIHKEVIKKYLSRPEICYLNICFFLVQKISTLSTIKAVQILKVPLTLTSSMLTFSIKLNIMITIKIGK